MVVAEQVHGDPVGDAQRAGQERPLGLLDDHEPALEQRRALHQAMPRNRGRGQRARELEREADARAAARHVVVQIAVEPLETRVDVRRERHEQQLDVDRSEREGPGEPAQAHVLAALLGLVGRALDLREELRAGLGGGVPLVRGEQPLDVVLREVEPAERVVRVRVAGAARGHGGTHARLDDPEPAEEMRERRVGGALGHG